MSDNKRDEDKNRSKSKRERLQRLSRLRERVSTTNTSYRMQVVAELKATFN